MADRIISIYSTSNEIEANRVSQLLAHNGIDSHLHNAKPQDLFGMGRLGTGYSIAVGLIEVQIHEKQQEEALAILKSEMELEDSLQSPSDTSDIGFKKQDAGQPGASRRDKRRNVKPAMLLECGAEHRMVRHRFAARDLFWH